jgi:hypothetical protein
MEYQIAGTSTRVRNIGEINEKEFELKNWVLEKVQKSLNIKKEKEKEPKAKREIDKLWVTLMNMGLAPMELQRLMKLLNSQKPRNENRINVVRKVIVNYNRKVAAKTALYKK